MGRDVVGAADWVDGWTWWKRDEDLSVALGTVFYASSARTALGFQEVYE